MSNPRCTAAPGSADVLYLVDLSNYVFRAFHAIAPLDGTPGIADWIAAADAREHRKREEVPDLDHVEREQRRQRDRYDDHQQLARGEDFGLAEQLGAPGARAADVVPVLGCDRTRCAHAGCNNACGSRC